MKTEWANGANCKPERFHLILCLCPFFSLYLGLPPLSLPHSLDINSCGIFAAFFR